MEKLTNTCLPDTPGVPGRHAPHQRHRDRAEVRVRQEVRARAALPELRLRRLTGGGGGAGIVEKKKKYFLILIFFADYAFNSVLL